MEIAGSVALVTGANRGIGREFTKALVERGAAKVYATARNPELIDIPGVETLRLDITDPNSVAEAAKVAQDVTLVINNAGIETGQSLVKGDLDKIRQEIETHYFGTLNVVRGFADILAENGGGAILNVLSALSWLAWQGTTGYTAAKAAEWGLTNGIRVELAGQGTLVTGLHLGATDTDMIASWDIPKGDPADVVRAALDGIEADTLEVLADDTARSVKQALSDDPRALYPQLAVSAS
jgi:NAD(P)-dependent dehydrogenase (short-subunit alcohol dehydrogenase family)